MDELLLQDKVEKAATLTISIWHILGLVSVFRDGKVRGQI
jgi:hypothetical protein